MRRFAKLFMALAALSLAGVGCNPGDFSALADDAWADSRDPDVTSTDKNVFMGYAPRNNVVNRAQWLVYGDGPISLLRYQYSTTGSFERSNTDVQSSTDSADDTAEIRFARSRDDGYTAAMLRRPNNDYLLFGDYGEAMGGDTFVEPFAVPSGAEPETADSLDVDYRGIAISGSLVAGVGPLRDGGEERYLEASEIGNLNSADRCQFDPTLETSMPPVYTVNDGVVILDGSDPNPDAADYIVSTNIGLRLASLPTVEPEQTAGVCITVEVDSAGVLVDSRLDVYSSLGGDGKDVVGAQIGDTVLVLVDHGVGNGNQEFTNTIVIPAPDGAGDEWGSALAVGDYDDDGVSELAVGDPGEGTVHIFELDVANESASLAKTIEPFDSRDRFGKSLAAVPFDDDGKDLLVVGTDSDVITYFRLFTDEESDSDLDPR